MKHATRLNLSLLPGITITFSLLILMKFLIAVGALSPEQTPVRKIARIFQPERELTFFFKETKSEKPKDAEHPPPETPQPDEEFNTSFGAYSINPPPFDTSMKFGLGGFVGPDTDYIPIYVPQPPYPRRALHREVNGYAVVELTITKSGEVKNARLLEEFPSKFGFGDASLKAARKLKYNPRIIDGTPQEVSGVRYKFVFEIEH